MGPSHGLPRWPQLGCQVRPVAMIWSFGAEHKFSYWWAEECNSTILLPSLALWNLIFVFVPVALMKLRDANLHGNDICGSIGEGN